MTVSLADTDSNTLFRRTRLKPFLGQRVRLTGTLNRIRLMNEGSDIQVCVCEPRFATGMGRVTRQIVSDHLMIRMRETALLHLPPMGTVVEFSGVVYAYGGKRRRYGVGHVTHFDVIKEKAA